MLVEVEAEDVVLGGLYGVLVPVAPYLVLPVGRLAQQVELGYLVVFLKLTLDI